MKIPKKQEEVLSLLYQGFSIKDIAYKLNKKESTINTHKDRLFKKFNVGSIRELLAKKIYDLQDGNVYFKQIEELKAENKALKKYNKKLNEYKERWEILKIKVGTKGDNDD